MPSFDNFFGLRLVSIQRLKRMNIDEYIYFNSGSHVQTVRMRYKEFARFQAEQYQVDSSNKLLFHHRFRDRFR
jgi:hypothetical protein